MVANYFPIIRLSGRAPLKSHALWPTALQALSSLRLLNTLFADTPHLATTLASLRTSPHPLGFLSVLNARVPVPTLGRLFSHLPWLMCDVIRLTSE